MQREIKFRAWDSGNNTMMFEFPDYDYYTQMQNGVLEVGTTIDGDYRELPLMQSTGLKDKNGVEIWEGDLVKHHNDFGLPVAEVAYIIDHGCWALLHDSFKRTVTQYKRLTQKTLNESGGEVVGNIHQNRNR